MRKLLFVVLLLALALQGAAIAQDTPQVGGRLVIAIPNDPDTLDIHKSGDGNAMSMAWLMGATLVARDTEANYHPWLAESWETSEDGMTWTFKIREDVKFHDGTPMTAADFAYAINRLIDPEEANPQSGRMASVASAEAPDATTLVLHMKAPYPLVLEQVSNTGVVQPYSQKFVEEQGDQFGRTFMGVGPYRFVEWRTGESILLERNPDFNWGPPFVENQGPYYIEQIEFRIIPEPATIVAGLEAGEIDYALINGPDVAFLRETGQVDVYEAPTPGMNPAIHMNLSMPLFQDLRVRQAFSMAVDRQTLVNVVIEGLGTPQYGPLSPNIRGYLEETDEIGYHFDLEQAKALMAEAGFTPGADGILTRDGEPLALTLKCASTDTRLCEVLQAQYQNLGVSLTIETIEPGLLLTDALGGSYEIMSVGYFASESDILYRWFHTSRPGALNLTHGSLPELDAILDLTRSDVANRDQHVDDAQRYMIENAIVIPLYNPLQFTALSTRVEGEIFNPAALSATLTMYLNDAWIEG